MTVNDNEIRFIKHGGTEKMREKLGTFFIKKGNTFILCLSKSLAKKGNDQKKKKGSYQPKNFVKKKNGVVGMRGRSQTRSQSRTQNRSQNRKDYALLPGQGRFRISNLAGLSEEARMATAWAELSKYFAKKSVNF
jgi:hypothetical protein